MTPQNDKSWPAFPGPHIYMQDGNILFGANGMTLRDYFAAKALMMANVLDIEADADLPDQLAAWSYRVADAMLKARMQ